MYAFKISATVLLALATAASVSSKAIPSWDGEDFITNTISSYFPATTTVTSTFTDVASPYEYSQFGKRQNTQQTVTVTETARPSTVTAASTSTVTQSGTVIVTATATAYTTTTSTSTNTITNTVKSTTTTTSLITKTTTKVVPTTITSVKVRTTTGKASTVTATVTA